MIQAVNKGGFQNGLVCRQQAVQAHLIRIGLIVVI
jgi:hypothetical protein